jgi:hypothetical protein
VSRVQQFKQRLTARCKVFRLEFFKKIFVLFFIFLVAVPKIKSQLHFVLGFVFIFVSVLVLVLVLHLNVLAKHNK